MGHPSKDTPIFETMGLEVEELGLMSDGRCWTVNHSERVPLGGWGSRVRKRRQKGKTRVKGGSGEPGKHIYTSEWILKVVQWLRICLPVCETWVRFLLGELRSHMPQGKISYNY